MTLRHESERDPVIEVAVGDLSREALLGLAEEFVSREGSDDGIYQASGTSTIRRVRSTRQSHSR